MIRNIVFDMGGVLIRFDTDVFLDRYDLCPEERTLLLREIFLSVEWSMLDRGSLREKEMLETVYRRIPAGLHEAAQGLVLRWNEPLVPIPGMEELIRELKTAGYRIFLLSNASVRQHDYWPQIPGASYFEDTLISADVHLVKPQPEIYRAAVDKFGILPEESVFIDDNTLNIEAALNAGMHGIVFHQDVDELQRKLRQLGVPGADPFL